MCSGWQVPRRTAEGGCPTKMPVAEKLDVVKSVVVGETVEKVSNPGWEL